MSKTERAEYKIIEEAPNCIYLRIIVAGKAVGMGKAYRDKTNTNRLKVYPVQLDWPYNRTLDFPDVVWRQNLAWE